MGKKKKDNDQRSTINDQLENVQTETVEEEIKEIEVNIDYKDKWLRAQADYQNLLKETEARRAEWAQYSEQQILEEFIPVYDNFKKAFFNDQRSTINDQDGWTKGIEYIMKQFGVILKAHGVKEIKTVGEEFNPELHEAMGEEESDEFEGGRIMREVEAGYRMKGKIVKVAKVIIAKHESQAT